MFWELEWIGVSWGFSTMSEELGGQKIELSAAKQALLRARLKQDAALKAVTIPQRAQLEAPPSSAQRRLWFLDQLYPHSCVYNVPRVFRLNGQLNLRALQQALTSIVERHEILRTNFKLVDEEPIQFVREKGGVTASLVDLTSFPAVEREAKAQQLVETEVQRPFDLLADLMLRATVLRLQKDEHILVLMSHHIASDGWSKGVMFHELAAFYNAALTQKPPALADLPIQYSDFAVWQRQWLEGAVRQNQVAYGKRQLAGGQALLELPTDYPRPALQGFSGAIESRVFPSQLVRNLKTLSQREGVTLFMTLLASFQLLLSRYAGQDDVVTGTPIAGRTRPELEPLIGDFVNMLAIRTDLSGDPSFRELLRRVKETALQAYDNQDLPFESLVEELEHGRDMSRAPIFQTIFLLQASPPPRPPMEGLAVRILDFDTPTAKNDLILVLVDDPAGLKVKLLYRTDLFLKATIDRFVQQCLTLLEAIVAHPELPISRLAILPVDERYQVLLTWNNTAGQERVDRCIHQEFEEQCAL